MNKDDLGGPNKHSPADPDKLAAMSAEMSQKDKIQMRQAALKKKLEAEKARKVAENLKKQTQVNTFQGPIRRRYGGEGALQR